MAWADLAARVDRAAAKPFEVYCTYTFDTAGAATAVDIRGVFDAAGQRADVAGAEIITTQPQIGLHVADLPAGAPAEGDTVLIGATTWTVESWDVDGPGVGVMIWLRDAT